MVIALLFTLVFFPLVGRVVHGANAFLAGAGLTGLVLFIAMTWHMTIIHVLSAIAVSGVLQLVRRAPALVKLEKADVPLLLGALFLLIVSALVPLSDYDGRAFWLIKAKAIVHEKAIDGPFFLGETAGNPRNEYPLLVPLDAAACLTVAGDLDDRNVRWLYAMFAIAFAWEIRRRCGPWLGAALLFLPQLFIESAFTAYSDIALGAFVACAFFELMDDGEPWRYGFWIACVALTKNEGLPLALLLLIAAAIVWRKRIAVALIAPAIALVHLFIWRSRIHRSDEENFASTLLDLPSHAERLSGSAGHLLADVANVRNWGIVLIAIAIAFFFAKRGRVIVLMIVAPMLFLYASAVAVAPWPLDVMRELAPRVLTQLLGPLFFVLREGIGITPARSR